MAPFDRWASFGCHCLTLPAELSPAEAAVDVEEDWQVAVAIAPLAVLVINAHLLALANDTLLLARRRHLGQRASVVKGVQHWDLRLFVTVLATENRVASKDDFGWVLTAVQRVTVRILETRNGRDDQSLGVTDLPTAFKALGKAIT